MTEENQEIVKSRKGSHCLNCETTLNNEAYCPVCGQENTNRNISIWTLLQDFLGDYFSFDSKFFTTLIPLFVRPGKVPKEFMEGHRVKHIPPFRILIFSSFIFFTVWGLTFSPDADDSKSISTIIKEDVIESSDGQILGIDSLIQSEADTNDILDINFTSDSSDGLQKKLEGLFASLDAGKDLTSTVDSIAVDNTEFQKRVITQIGKMYQSDRGTITKYFIGNLSLIILIIQPFFALLLKLLYIRRRKEFKFVGHLVFSFYFHAWILVLLTIGLLINQAWEGLPLIRFVVIPSLIYLAFAIKRFYGQSWGKSLLKVFLIFLFYTMLVFVFLGLSFLTSFYFF